MRLVQIYGLMFFLLGVLELRASEDHSMNLPVVGKEPIKSLETIVPNHELESMFSDWAKDPFLRMPDPGAHCFD